MTAFERSRRAWNVIEMASAADKLVQLARLVSELPDADIKAVLANKKDLPRVKALAASIIEALAR